MNNKLKPIAIAVGAAFAGSLASVALACDTAAKADLFAAEELERSYDLLAQGDDSGGDGSCGDGTCGDDAGDDSGDEGGDSGGDAGDSGDA